MSEIGKTGANSFQAHVTGGPPPTDIPPPEPGGVGNGGGRSLNLTRYDGEDHRKVGHGQIELPPPRLSGINEVNGAVVNLRSLSASPVNIQQIAQVMQEANLRERDSARLDRQAARDADVAAQHQAADKIRDAANFNFAATIATSAMSVLGAVASTVGAVKAINIRADASAEAEALTNNASSLRLDALEDTADATTMRTDAAKLGTPGDPMTVRQQAELNQAAATMDRSAVLKNLEAQQLETSAQKITLAGDVAAKKLDTYSQLGGTAVTEAGKATGAALQRVAAERDAERSELQAKSTVARNQADDQSDFIRAYSDNIRAVLDKLSAIQQAEADTNRTILRG